MEKIVKLEFAQPEPDDLLIKVISQCMFEAANSAKLSLKPSAVLLYDVPRGVIHKGARVRSRMLNDIESTCKNISAIWDTI